MLTLELYNDTDVESPCTEDGWTLYSFSNRHNNYRDPYTFLSELNADRQPVPVTEALAEKLRTGLAFWVSCYQHGNSQWGLPGEVHQCQWDTVQLAGILIWESEEDDLGPTTLEARTEDARNFLKTYTDWANGNCYGYSIEDEDGQDVGSCGGFIGAEYMFEEIKATLQGREVKATGEAAWLAEYYL